MNALTCDLSDSCDIDSYYNDNSDGYFAYIGSGSNVTIYNTVIDSIFGNYGFKSENQTYINIIDSLITYNSFYYSFIMIDTSNKYKYGHYLIENTIFEYNSGDNGSIINIEEIDDNSSIIINNSIFNNNYGIYGGVIYSV
eukprot:jgi/Orpsp1_1/1181713/evm.model.c7180000078284.1